MPTEELTRMAERVIESEKLLEKTFKHAQKVLGTRKIEEVKQELLRDDAEYSVLIEHP